MTTKLKEIAFTKVGPVYKVIGIYKVYGTVFHGQDFEPSLQTLEEGESYYLVRTAGKKLAYANSVPFCDLCTTSLSMELAMMRKAQ